MLWLRLLARSAYTFTRSIMGLILSIFKYIFTALSLIQPNRRKEIHLATDQLNEIATLRMQLQIQSRLQERLLYFDFGVSILSPSFRKDFAHQMALNLNDHQIFAELANVVCYTFGYPYAELWMCGPGQPSSINLIKYFVRNLGLTDNMSIHSEYVMRGMGHNTENLGNITATHEVAGVAILENKPVWATPADVSTSLDNPRKKLISSAGFKSCFAVPVVKSGRATYALCFFRKEECQPDVELIGIIESMFDEIFRKDRHRQVDLGDGLDGCLSDFSTLSEETPTA